MSRAGTTAARGGRTQEVAMASLHITADKDSYQVHCSQHGSVALGLRDRTDALIARKQHLESFHATDQKDTT